VHYLHHKNINFGPWSGVAMHPIEHLLYFSSVILFWIIPSHPLHSILVLQNLALGPSVSHLGFARVVFSKKFSLDTDDYMHYLHHKYVSANFGASTVPVDKWLGTFHDGSDQAHEAMKKRMRARPSATRAS
jgi:sterol desaturase/sphingolipid hydroxylase (fatty acid hydroxylase superfamily)